MRRLVTPLLAALVLAPVPAWAALRVPAPPGWDRGSMVPADTFADAKSLASKADASLVEVFAGPEDDDYIESVVVLERAEALAPEALSDLASARGVAEQWSALWVAEVSELEVTIVDRDETSAIEATFESEGIVWMLLIAPTGPSTGVVVVRGRADELPLYRRSFREVLDSAEGAEPPVEPINRGRARLYGVIGWIVGGAAAVGIGLATAPIAGDMRHATKRAAIVLAGASVIVGGALLALFTSRAPAVEAGGASPVGFSLELMAYGIVLAALALAFSLFGPEPRRIQSAPTNTPRLPTAKPGQLRPSTIPSRLEPADTRSTIPPDAPINVPSASDLERELGQPPKEDTQPTARAIPSSLRDKPRPSDG